MKNYLTIFFSITLVLNMLVFIAYAQDNIIDEKKWTRIEIDPNKTTPVDPGYKWDNRPHEVRYYDFDGSGITVNPNFRPWPGSNTTQSELSVDVHPLDANIVFASANATTWPFSTIWGTGVYWTLDGGLTWDGADDPGTLPGFVRNSGDPASVIGTNGYFYEGYISNSGGMGVSVSTNFGSNWSSYTVDNLSDDKNHLMVDKVVGSTYENRVYNSWTAFGGANNNDVVLKYSANFGQTWSATKNLSNALNAGSHNQGINIQTGPNGEVYASWSVYDAWPGGEDAIGFNISTDGGETWGTPTRIYSAINFGIRGDLKPTQIRVASFPSMAVDRTGGVYNGYIYICWPQRNVAPAGSDPDIVMISSSDGGTTWSSPVRVNDDPLNNGKDQYYPWMTVDQSTGQLMFVFYDSRETTNDSTGVWMARSFDAGSTFENFRVSDENFKPKPISGLAGGYQGDYIGIAALNDIAYPYWMEDRTGNYQGWMSIVNFGPPCPIDPPSNPNPANGATDVSVDLTQITWNNGTGATQIEVWFGEAGSMVMVYTGSPVTSWNIPSQLDYNTSYSWRVIGKNDTCNVYGPSWAFTTELSPGIIFLEPFPDLNNWTVSGPLGLTNWSISSTNNAGSAPPELNFHWSPSFDGLSRVMSVVIPAVNDHDHELSFNNFIDHYSDPAPYQGIGVTYDGGTSVDVIMELQSVGGNLGPALYTANFLTPLTGSENLQLVIYSNGNSFNIDDVYWDDIMLIDLEFIPVELTSFVAAVNKSEVVLNWTTATEINNLGFEIQRSSADGNFQKVGFVPGHGSTTEIQTYEYIDSKVADGNYSYRLKQIDFDGTFDYSNEVAVDIAAPLEFALNQNYPNPFNPNTVIEYSIPQSGFVILAVYNLLGEKVASLVNELKEAGRYEINFDASDLASGIYVYNLKSGSFNSVKKMLLMK
jgi:hypothetical protein